MNEYGRNARTYWQIHLPRRFSAIPAPERTAFFTDLGEQAANQIADLSADLAGDDPPQESYLSKVGRLNAARQQAQETVLAELILLPPEPGTEPQERDRAQAHFSYFFW